MKTELRDPYLEYRLVDVRDLDRERLAARASPPFRPKCDIQCDIRGSLG
jgi:hypothetical protein